MPVEIRELVIRAVVADERPRSGESSEGANGEGSPDLQQIIEESVRQVLKILRRREER